MVGERLTAMHHLLNWIDTPAERWDSFVERSVELAARRTWTKAARGKSICLLFMNPSLRTRTSMELAAAQLGAYVTVLSGESVMWRIEFADGVRMDGDAPEHVREAAAVLSGYYDAIGIRTFASLSDRRKDKTDSVIKRFAEFASVPVVNLESARFHPCQSLADAATLRRRFGRTSGRKFVLAWCYHPRALPMAVPNSTALMAARLGMDVTIAHPSGFELDSDILERSHSYAQETGGSVRTVHDLEGALDGADVVYAKSWASNLVYENADSEAMLRRSNVDWSITFARMSKGNVGAFMHCLPVRRNVVVDDAVLDSAASLHLEQAANRLHAQKAILESVLQLDVTPEHA